MEKQSEALGLVGLGKMGSNLALQALEKGLRVVGLDVKGAPQELRQSGLVQAQEAADFRRLLPPPRAVFVYVPAGPTVDRVLDGLADVLEPGDVLVDGGNSYWGDSIRRHERYRGRGLRFVDLGTSGGMEGARHGACFMAGGEPEAFRIVEPILRALAVPEGVLHAGPPGAGHFVKLVHNGIEFGMLQAIGEGMGLLARSRFRLDLEAVLHVWNHGSVIRSWLVELMEQSVRQYGGLQGIPPYVEDTGEVNWLVGDAMHMEVPIPVISQAVMNLLASRDPRSDWARAVAMMRHGFGGHPFGPDPGIVRERREGRVGPYLPPDADRPC